VILGLLLALASALATNLAFLFKHRGAVLAPPIRSAIRCAAPPVCFAPDGSWSAGSWRSWPGAVLSDGRRLTVYLLPGDTHALLLEEAVADFRPDALDRVGLTARESEVLRAASVIESEAELAWALFLSLHAVRERPARLEAKLGVRTAGDAVARGSARSL
jgi:DNA-binding CsgD family transcriptional regulator